MQHRWRLLSSLSSEGGAGARVLPPPEGQNTGASLITLASELPKILPLFEK